MTDKNDYNASLRGRGLDGTGVTEDIAKTMYHTKGSTTLAIVEVHHKRQIDDEDTGRKIELAVGIFEPSTDPTLDDYLRRLARTLQQNRVLHSEDQQLQIDTTDDLEPTIEQVIAAGQHHVTDDDGQDDDELVQDAHILCPTPGCILDEEHPGNHELEEGLADYEAEQDAAAAVGRNPFVTT